MDSIFIRATDIERQRHSGDYPLCGHAEAGGCRIAIERRIRHNGGESFWAIPPCGVRLVLDGGTRVTNKLTSPTLAGLLAKLESASLIMNGREVVA